MEIAVISVDDNKNKKNKNLLLITTGPSKTWKMFETLPEEDCSFPDFTQKCTNYVNFEIATKQRNLSANSMFTTFTG